MTLPADDHVHTQWSWDAPDGDMEQTCARAVAIGLPAVAFTEHADHTTWTVTPGSLDESEHLRGLLDPDGTLTPPQLDVGGYLDSVQRCRDLFPQLRILSGVELGEPHWHTDATTALLQAGQFDRVLGSLHSLPIGDRFAEPPDLYRQRPAAEVIRDYLAELPRLVAECDAFTVLAHIDYPLRSWPDSAGPFEPLAFEDEFRFALRTLADSGRVLEVNTAGRVYQQIVGWWHDEGGEAVSFGSDTHEPTALAHGFTDATAMVEAHGFRPGRHLYDFWIRAS